VLVGSVLGGLIAAAAVTIAFFWIYVPSSADLPGLPAAESTSTAPVTIEVVGVDPGFAEAVAAKVTPSVVSIAIAQTAYDPFTGQLVTQEAGSGSGVIIRSDGYVLTNDHVIADADAVTVSIGMEELPATVVGRDPSSDLAVVKVQRTGLPAAELGSSSDLVVGEPVVAIGSPFGLDRTVTTGIVSALGRVTFAEGAGAVLTAYTSLIQTDAAINPGNSGGALCDARGRVIGINTLIQSPSGQVGAPQSAGIGFAIPIDYARTIADELIETGRATHPYMGVSTVTISRVLAQRYGLPTEAGAFVQTVDVGSPAEAAGIERGDIIVSIADAPVRSVEDVFAAVRTARVGQIIDVRLWRGDDELTVSVTLGSDANRQ
jgi:putative serine protease PepD